MSEVLARLSAGNLNLLPFTALEKDSGNKEELNAGETKTAEHEILAQKEEE